MDELEQRARAAIDDLMQRYVEGVDGGHIENLLLLFTEGGRLVVHGPREYIGRDAIGDFLRFSKESRRNDSFGRIRHHVSRSAVHFDGPHAATSTSYFVAMNRLGPDHWGVYRDRIASAGEEWLFAIRAVTIEGADPNGWIGSGAGTVEFKQSG